MKAYSVMILELYERLNRNYPCFMFDNRHYCQYILFFDLQPESRQDMDNVAFKLWEIYIQKHKQTTLQHNRSIGIKVMIEKQNPIFWRVWWWQWSSYWWEYLSLAKDGNKHHGGMIFDEIIDKSTSAFKAK